MSWEQGRFSISFLHAWEPFFKPVNRHQWECFLASDGEAQAAAGHKMKDLGQSLLEKTFEVPGLGAEITKFSLMVVVLLARLRL